MILVVGEALVDLIISPNGRVSAELGGAPFNAARACARLGAEVAFGGSISRDRFGEMIVAQLVADGVDVSRATRVEQPTTLAAAELDDTGAATYRFYIDGTSAPSFDAGSLALDGPFVGPIDETVDAVMTGGLALVLEPMATGVASLVGRPSATTLSMIDVNCRPALIDDRVGYVRRMEQVCAAARVVKLSTEDAEFLHPDRSPAESARGFIAAGSDVVLMTDGSRPVLVYAGAAGEWPVPIPAVDVVDTIGAGDTFSGAFLAEWLARGNTVGDLHDGDRLRSVVEFAVEAAAVACGRAGADPPWRSELPAP